jgi:hypothetical protein
MIKKIALAIILLVSVGLNSYFVISKNNEMTATEVHDGDTFTLGDGQRVRLLGINAPELGNCGATESATLLKSLVLNKLKSQRKKEMPMGGGWGLFGQGQTLSMKKC